MREYRFLNDVSFNELEDLNEPETGSALHQNANLMLTNSPYSPCSARSQASFTHDWFCREGHEDAVKFVRDVRAPRAHGPFCSGSTFF